MNVLVLHGSARRNGDTDTLAKHFLRGMEEESAHDVVHVYPIDMRIEHCRACEACTHGKGCVIADDMQDVYPAFRQAEVIVIATPMFWGYMTSQLKTLFDRLEAVVSPAYFGDKDFVLLVGYRRYYGSVVEWLERVTRGFESRCHHILCRTFDPDKGIDIPVADLPGALESAYSLGRELATSA